MATPEQCKYYGQCGFVRWRQQKLFMEVQQLPEDGDCGIEVGICQRVHAEIPIAVTDFGPQTSREFDVSLPQLTNNNDRPNIRRLHGGGHQ